MIIKKIKELLESGASFQETAKAVNMTKKELKVYLDLHPIDIKRPEAPAKRVYTNSFKKWNEECDRLKALKAEGKTSKQIAEIFGVSDSTIQSVLSYYGILRPPFRKSSLEIVRLYCLENRPDLAAKFGKTEGQISKTFYAQINRFENNTGFADAEIQAYQNGDFGTLTEAEIKALKYQLARVEKLKVRDLTDEQKQFVLANRDGQNWVELAKKLNANFGLKATKYQVHYWYYQLRNEKHNKKL
jgi:hypothetical protein